MNESIDDTDSSNISSTTNSRSSSNSEIGNGSHQGSSIGSAGSLMLRNRISNARKNTNLVLYLLYILPKITMKNYHK